MEYLFTKGNMPHTVTATGTEVAEIRMSSLANVAWVHTQCQGLGPGMALVLGEGNTAFARSYHLLVQRKKW